MSGVPDRVRAVTLAVTLPRRAISVITAIAAITLPVAALVLVATVAAQPTQPALRSTQDGVYTLTQANEGKDLFAGLCQSCHTPTVHAGPPFRNKWFGASLGDLFGYLRREMPKTDPGSLTDDEYAQLVAYLMRINGMPTGSNPLAADSAMLHRIRIDSVARTSAAPSPPDPRR